MSNKKLLLIIAVVVVLAGIGFWGVLSRNMGNGVGVQNAASSTLQSDVSSASTTPVAVMQPTSQLFSSLADYSRAYEVWPTLTSGQAQRAISGFDVQVKDLASNIYEVSLVAKEQNYKTQVFVVSGSDKVFFVEKAFGDDSAGKDYAYGDDYGLAVDANGYVLQ